MPASLPALADLIDRFTRGLARAAMWLSVAIVLVQLAVVLMRYVLGIGSIWVQESILYGHAALFLLTSAWALRAGAHVRVDLLHGRASAGGRALVDLAGALLFLLPFAAVLAWFSIPFAARSWAILERSPEASGLPFVFVLKTLVPVFAVLLLLQGIAQAIRSAEALLRPPAPRAG